MTEPAAEARDGKSLLPRLTSLRWYAALVVLLFHANATLDWRPLRVFTFGQSGVAFFFVLSGFVLTWSYSARVSKQQFWRRRFARIYPSHLVMWLIAVAVGIFLTDHVTTRPAGIVAGLLLLQAWSPTPSIVYAANAPAWSLSCEAFFYGLFPWLHRRLTRWTQRRLVTVLAATVAAGAVATQMLGRHGLGSTVGFNNPAVRLPEFVLGIGLAVLVQRGLRSPVPLWAALVFTAVSAVAARQVNHYVIIPAVALLLVTAATYDIRGVRGPMQSRLSVWLGEVSFALYLVHQLVQIGLEDTIGLRGPVGLLITFGISLACAAALHHGVELPAQRRLSRSRRAAPAEAESVRCSAVSAPSPELRSARQ